MAMVLLDSGPLGMLAHPRPQAAIVAWFADLRRRGTAVRVSELADYEVRREWLRANLMMGVQRLDDLGVALGSLAVTRAVLLRAAELWAQARQQGRPTAGDAALDGDVIIAAQAQLAATPGDPVIVATTNVAHLGRFVDARLWQDIV